MSSKIPAGVELLFLRRGNVANQAAWYLIGGILGIGVCVLGGVITVMFDVDVISRQVITTLPLILGIGALAAYRTISKTPTQVSVGTSGICVEGQRGTLRRTWDEIGWAAIATGTMNQRRHLAIYDTNGKVITKISDAFEGFDKLAELVKDRLAEKQDDVASRIQKRKSKQSGAFVIAFGLFFMTTSGGSAWMTWAEQQAAARLEAEGVEGDARILRRFVAPNGYTKRVEYEITSPSGAKGTRNAEVTPDSWNSLEGETTVPVVYVEADPNNSRLVKGEIQENNPEDRPAVRYGLAGVMGLISLFFLAGGVLQLCSWDIAFDSTTMKVSIKRFGTAG